MVAEKYYMKEETLFIYIASEEGLRGNVQAVEESFLLVL